MAKSRFWYFIKRLKRLKRTKGEVISVEQIPEPEVTKAKTFGILIRYDSRTGTHNMYKEFRAVSVCDAVSKMYQEMSGRHSARPETIFIVKTCEIEDLENARREMPRLLMVIF